MTTKKHLSYANVASTLALVIAVGGGGVAVAATLPANSVGSTQVKDNSLLGVDIQTGTLTTSDIKDGSLTGTDVKNGSLTGTDVKDSSLTGTDVKDSSLTGTDLAAGTITDKNLTSNAIGVVRGYAWNDQPSAPLNSPVTIGGAFAYNSAGGSVTMVRTATGVYSVDFPGLNFFPGNVQVSAYQTNGYCNVGDWGASSVNVRCYTPAGAPADSYFSLAVIK